MSALRLCSAALAVALALQAAAVRAEDPPDTWYAQAIAQGGAGLNVTHFWSKGSKLRAETVVAGRRVVTIVSGEYYYAYDSLGRQGVAIRRAASALERDAKGERPFGRELEILLDQGAEAVRQDKLMGRPCDVYRVTDSRGKRELWVTHDEARLPVRLEIYERRTGTQRQTDYLNWLANVEIPDAFFQPEAGVEIQRLELDEYLRITSEQGPVGPVPVFYADLLHGRKKGFGGGPDD